MNTTRAARLLILSLALAACVSDPTPPSSDDTAGSTLAGRAAENAGASQPTDGPGLSSGPGPGGEMVAGIDVRGTAAGQVQPTTLARWPVHGAGRDLGPDDQLAFAPAALADVPEDSVELDAEPGKRPPSDGVAVAKQALTLAATTVHARVLPIGGYPHEPTMSLGRSQIVMASRASVSIMSKGNRLLYQDTSNNFFAASLNMPNELFDCRAVYAPTQNRHVVMCLQNWDIFGFNACGDPTYELCTGQIYIAVSRNAYPTGPADFVMYRTPNVDSDGDALTRNEGDYPYLGVTNNMLVVSMLMREGTALGSAGWNWIDTVRVFSMDDLAAGVGFATLRQWAWWGHSFDYNNTMVTSLVPALHWGDTSNTAYLVSYQPDSAKGILLWKLKNPFDATRSMLPSPVTGQQDQLGPCGDGGDGNVCSQLTADNNHADAIAPSPIVMHYGGRFYSPSWRNNRLVFVRDQVRMLDGVPKAVLRYGVINTTTNTAAIDSNIQSSVKSVGLGGVAITNTNDAAIGFIRAELNTFPQLCTRLFDRNNLISSSTVLMHTANYPFARQARDAFGNLLWNPPAIPPFPPVPGATPVVTHAFYDVGVTVAAEPDEDAVWVATQYANRAPTSQDDWNAGLVFGKSGGVKRVDVTIPRYKDPVSGTDHAKTAIPEVATMTRGTSVTVTVRFENFGDAPTVTGGVPVSLCLSTDQTITSADTCFASGSVNASAGQTTAVSFTGAPPTTMSARDYFLGVRVTQNPVNEYDTANNSMANDTKTTLR
jgi:hypothetical protein